MKLEKLDGKAFESALPKAGGAIGGAMLSEGIVSVVGKVSATPTTAELNKRKLVRVALAGLGIVACAVAQGKDSASAALQGAGLGVAAVNTMALVSDLVKNNATITQKLAADTTANRFLKGTLGLGCPCEANAPVPVVLNRPMLRNPIPYLAPAPQREKTFEEVMMGA